MDIDRNRLLASRDAALAAKAAFMSAYGPDLSNCAVGLGVSRDGQDWTFKVYARTAAVESHLPRRFDEYEVDVEVAGAVSALTP